MNEQTCDLCKRQKWDGGHALNEDECDEVNGEVCRLWQVLKGQTEALLAIRDQADQYMQGLLSNMELAGGVREKVRRALDESIPAGSIFIQSWCGGEEGEYARCVHDRDRLLKERDAANATLAKVREDVHAAEMCLPTEKGFSEFLAKVGKEVPETSEDIDAVEGAMELQDALTGVREALISATKLLTPTPGNPFVAAVNEERTKVLKEAGIVLTVHLLRAGLPVCGFSREVPRDWPSDQRWAPSVAELKALKPPQVPCMDCIRKDQQERQRPR